MTPDSNKANADNVNISEKRNWPCLKINIF